MPEQDTREKQARRKHGEQSRLRPHLDASGHELGGSRGVKKATRLALGTLASGKAAKDCQIPWWLRHNKRHAMGTLLASHPELKVIWCNARSPCLPSVSETWLSLDSDMVVIGRRKLKKVEPSFGVISLNSWPAMT